MRRWAWAAAAVAAAVVAGFVVWQAYLRPPDLEVEVESVTAAGRTLTVRFLAGPEPCDSSFRVSADETPAAVTLTVVKRHHGDKTCPAIAVPYTRDVVLDAPLGERRVVDGATGQQVRVAGPV